MTKMANPVLLWFVGYSNLTSIAIVTFCFLAMTIFIGLISLNGDYQSRPNTRIGIEQRDMVKMANPFFLRIQQQSKKLADGIQLHLSSLLPSQIFVLWGPKINPFHDLILKPGKWIQEVFVLNKSESYQDLEILHLDNLQFSEAGEHSINLQCPDHVTSDTLGDMPRKRYPVAVFTFVIGDTLSCTNASVLHAGNGGQVMRECELQSESENLNSIIGLISIIHLQDDKVTQSSHIIGQYVKTSGVPLYSLQPLYLSTDSSQGQKNQHSRGNSAAQCQSTDRKCKGERSTVKFQRSNQDNSSKPATSPSVNNICDKSLNDNSYKMCTSCCEKINKNDSVLRKRDSCRTSELENEQTSICDMCHKQFGTMTNFKTISQPVEETLCPENEGESVLDELCDQKDEEIYEDETDIQANTRADCVVCQNHPIKCVLLPCRHACICLGCFKLLYRCPMCRAGIESYFLLRKKCNSFEDNSDEDDDSDVVDEDEVLQNLQHQAVNANFYQIWERFNTRLNNFFGFR